MAREGRPAGADAELESEIGRRRAPDADDPRVHAAQVVEGAVIENSETFGEAPAVEAEDSRSSR